MPTYTWNDASGSWSNPTNWAPIGVPGSDPSANDAVIIGQAPVNPIITNTISDDQSLVSPLASLTVTTYSRLTLGSGIGLSINGPMAINALGTVDLSGGTLVAAGGITFSDFGNLIGYGTISDATGLISGNGNVTASFGTLDIATTVSGQTHLMIGGFNSTLKIDGKATSAFPIETLSATNKLEVGAIGSLTIVGLPEGIRNGGTFQMDGGSFSDSNGLVISANSTLVGKGSVNAPILNGGSFSGNGILKASGGTLELTSDIAAALGPAFEIDTGAILQLDGAVGSKNVFSLLGLSSKLVYNHPGAITATIAGLNVGTSVTNLTNLVDFKNHSVTIVGSNAHTGTGGTLQLSDGSVLTLSGVTGNNSGTWFVDTKSDGSSGTDVFLSDMPVGTPPVVTGVTASPSDAVLGAGAVVTLTLGFSSPVNVVGGTPMLTLNNGGNATYTSGSGTSALTFNYIVAAGQDIPDLTVTAVSLNGATVTEQTGNAADLSGAAMNPAGTLAIEPSAIAAFNTTTNQAIGVVGHAYTGPVADLQREYVNITPDSINVTAKTPNWFIHSGSGTDGIAVTSGTNVLDGGTGSNFLSGGSGTDTFFVDDRGSMADIWSTVVGFHAGDAATIWGVTPQDFGLDWADGQGAAGYTGLTLHATAPGKPTASLTLAGYTQADLNNGRLSVLFGTDPASGSTYMYVHGDS